MSHDREYCSTVCQMTESIVPLHVVDNINTLLIIFDPSDNRISVSICPTSMDDSLIFSLSTGYDGSTRQTD